jgi:hypothetical protein
LQVKIKLIEKGAPETLSSASFFPLHSSPLLPSLWWATLRGCPAQASREDSHDLECKVRHPLHEQHKLFLIHWQQLAVGFGDHRGTASLCIDKCDLSHDPSWPDRFNGLLPSSDLYDPLFDDIHHVSWFALFDNEGASRKREIPFHLRNVTENGHQVLLPHNLLATLGESSEAFLCFLLHEA